MNETLKLIKSVNSYEVGGNSYDSIEWLSILFNRFSSLKYATSWIDQGTYAGTDVRLMVLFRIESATLWYEQNLISSSNLYEIFASRVEEHGYSKGLGISHISIQREVQNRIGFLDSVYFSIDYFISQLSEIHNITQSGQRKVDHFSNLLKHFNIENSGKTRNNIMKELKSLLPNSMSASEADFTEPSSAKLPYLKAFEYLTLIRNSLHNNGFSNKNMDNLSIGPIKYTDIQRNQSLNCMGLPNLILLILQMINAIEELCLLSVVEQPAERVDPHLNFMKDNLGFYP